jgi:hypothetical protein
MTDWCMNKVIDGELKCEAHVECKSTEVTLLGEGRARASRHELEVSGRLFIVFVGNEKGDNSDGRNSRHDGSSSREGRGDGRDDLIYEG